MTDTSAASPTASSDSGPSSAATTSSAPFSGVRNATAESWYPDAAAQLADGEAVLAWLTVDLDAHLHFARGVVVATDRRILAREATAGGASAHAGGWQSWPYREDLVLTHTDHAGVGSLELCDARQKLASWRYTLGHNPAALQLMDAVVRMRDIAVAAAAGRVLADEVVEVGTCPICQAELPAGVDECPQCNPETEAPPSTWALLRLWRFARPYRFQLLAGFLLTLCGTGATLIPPYLTMPLMDNVLIPFQNGQPIDYHLVGMYLSGLLGAGLVAWLLGWARTYLLAKVSERIGADLRTETYSHLLRLSLEYFGGKRTGDLMARIGSESDRICVFLSLHLLDFATDVLMIVMTAVILVSINPWLAVVTLVPLPFIAWLIHLVRDRLRHGFEKVDRIWAEITNVLADTIPGIRVVKAFAQETAKSRVSRKPTAITSSSTTA